MRINNTHPGIIIKNILVNEATLSVTEISKKLGVSRPNVSKLLNGHAAISLSMAVRLSKLLNTSIEMWINLQAQYNIYLAKKINKKMKVIPLNKLITWACPFCDYRVLDEEKQSIRFMPTCRCGKYAWDEFIISVL